MNNIILAILKCMLEISIWTLVVLLQVSEQFGSENYNCWETILGSLGIDNDNLLK